MKHILLYGATGRTGSLIVEYALSKGYKVTALVRNPEKMGVAAGAAGLTVIKGLPANIDDVRNAMHDCDVVMSTLSGLPASQMFSFRRVVPPHTMETAIRNTVQVMDESGVRKIVILSSVGVGESFKYAPWFMRLMIGLGNIRVVFDDHNGQEALVVKSALDWLVVKPVGLNDDAVLNDVAVTFSEKPPSFRISRLQVAHFMVDALENNEYWHAAPMISSKR